MPHYTRVEDTRAHQHSGEPERWVGQRLVKKWMVDLDGTGECALCWYRLDPHRASLRLEAFHDGLAALGAHRELLDDLVVAGNMGWHEMAGLLSRHGIADHTHLFD
ncbi:hypothetical protein V6N00_13135 [Tersicoccus sp. MR15.9]|uniref:hypothetical protein n=1 Tax=Tersicoccus mangrovi TaxID=3121635 RepID=UPI002FE5D7F1